MKSLFRPFAILSFAVLPMLAQPAPGPREGREAQAVLTPEQRARAAELRATRQAHRQERRRHFRMAMGMAG